MRLGHFRFPSRLLVGLAVAAATVVSCDDAPTTGGNATDYALELRFLGTAPTGATLQAFEAAQTTIRNTIVGGLSPVTPPPGFNIEDCNPADGTLSGNPDLPSEPLPGLVIYIHVRAMDGAGGTLGSAGPCLVRTAAQNHLPALGLMTLDQADLAAMTGARLEQVVLHEMLHVVGFGTIWDLAEVIDASADTANARFLGPRARTACANVQGGGPDCAATVPVHSTDGPGSRYAHWRESLFTVELMTPFLDNVATIPFSEMTIQSLGDLGYTVSNLTAQPYAVSGTFLMAERGGEEPSLQMPEPMRPRFTLTESGQLMPYGSSR
jgi:hypothetical protein